MRLIDLDPRWVFSGGEGITDTATGLPVPRREGVGIGFDCPCGCDSSLYVGLTNPLDGGPPVDDRPGRHLWTRTGDNFETMSLHPSIRRMSHCGWHGTIDAGVVNTAGDSPARPKF